MNDNVVPLNTVKHSYGLSGFLTCPTCQKEGESHFAPIGYVDKKGFVLEALMCHDCENEIKVFNGVCAL